jgi:hypothetical protein
MENKNMLIWMILACGEKESTDKKSYPTVELYDFDATGPWYSCPSYSTDGIIADQMNELQQGFPDEVIVVDGFVQSDQYFGSEDLRTIETTVNFPDEGDFSQVGLMFSLECPENGFCDHWDRLGSIQLIGEDSSMEILRYITPYRKEMCNYIDITPLAGELRGSKTIKSFIDTWVGPGHSDGEGWRVTTKFVFYPGAPAEPSQIIPIWGYKSITVGQQESGSQVGDQIEPFSFFVPSETKKVEVHVKTTGHSFGNTHNCAEFCKMRNDVVINEEILSLYPWRDDCPINPVNPQNGTWEHERNGWCPGAVVVGDVVDITDSVITGEDNLFDYDILLQNGVSYSNLSPVDLLPYTIISAHIYIYE